MHRVLITVGLLGLLLLVLAACGSAPPASPQTSEPASPRPNGRTAPPPASTAPAGRSAAAPQAPSAATRSGPLAAEQRWLSELFHGTPVQVVAEAGGAVRVDVPLQFAFDAGSVQPKPALSGVLQRVGQSLRRQSSARLGLAAPGPDSAERQRAMREQLIAMGLPAHRLSAPSPPSDSNVSLRLAAAPAAVQRLHDRSLPAVPTGAVMQPAVP